ncbi:hypothetical protein ACHAXH_001854 [Discostella pseudostelligera]
MFSHDCKYNVILGANFLAMTGIGILYRALELLTNLTRTHIPNFRGIEYSTKVVHWFDTELPMRDPGYLLNNDAWLAMTYIIETHCKEELMAWISTTQHATQLRYLMQNMMPYQCTKLLINVLILLQSQ